MKKLLILLVTLSLFAVPVIAQETKTEPAADETTKPEEKYDFRKIRWGMTVEEVKANEPGLTKSSEMKNAVFYRKNVMILGMKASLVYAFFFGKVYQGRYEFRVKHSYENAYIDDFNEVQQALEKKYGPPPPQTPEYIWKNRLYESDRSKHGFAVSIGHLKLVWDWYYPSPPYPEKTILINHSLYGDNYKIVHKIYYQSVEYKKMQKKVLQSQSNDL